MARVTTVSALTASIAHEVNQPLSGIITNAGTCLRMLDADPPNSTVRAKPRGGRIRDGNRASDVITRLRALFSKREFTLEPLDLNEATREVIALSSNELQRNRIILQSELADDLPTVTGDRDPAPAGHPEPAPQRFGRDGGRARSTAAVADQDRTGRRRSRAPDRPGCRRGPSTPDSMDKLFDAFYTTKSGGMGIGLFVSRSIIERHHGRLWAEPNDGGPGATFAFSIPYRAEA